MISDLYKEAYNLHSKGDLEQAENKYLEVIEKEPENSENPTFAQQAPLHADDGKGNRREANRALRQQPHPHPSRFPVPMHTDETHCLPNPPQTGRRRQAEEHLHATESRICARQRTLCPGGRRITEVAGLLPPIIG